MTAKEEEIIQLIRETSRKVVPPDGQVWLYGSRARGDAHEDSDWDILILLNKPKLEAGDYDDGHSVSTHHGSHAVFLLHYIKTGILPIEFGRLYNQLQTMREESDYNCAYDVDSDEVKEKTGPARQPVGKIAEMVKNTGN